MAAHSGPSVRPSTHPHGGHASPARPAVWPWLLVPVVALVLFVTLRAMRSAPDAHLLPAPAAASEAAETR